MKKLLLSAAAAMLLFSCQNEDNTNNTAQTPATTARRACATEEVFQRQLRENPELALKMNRIEEFNATTMEQGRLVNGKIEIPVVVNVLYKTAAENISLAQIQSQIDVLNKDFNAANSDYNQVPAEFAGVK